MGWRLQAAGHAARRIQRKLRPADQIIERDASERRGECAFRLCESRYHYAIEHMGGRTQNRVRIHASRLRDLIRRDTASFASQFIAAARPTDALDDALPRERL